MSREHTSAPLALERFERQFGTRVRTTELDGGTWAAELHDMYDDFAFKITVTGNSDQDALWRLSTLLAEIRDELL